MTEVSHAIGLLGAALLLAHLAACITLPARRSARFNRWFLAGASAVALVPFGECSAARLVWSALGYLSIPTLSLLLHRTVRLTTGRILLTRADLVTLHAGICVFALWFFPLAGGLGLYDPWSLGLQPVGLIVAVTGLGLLCIFTGRLAHACVLLLAVAAWQVRLLESANLWQYLCDPFLGFAAVFYVLYSLARGALQRVLGRVRAEAQPLEPAAAPESGS